MNEQGHAQSVLRDPGNKLPVRQHGPDNAEDQIERFKLHRCLLASAYSRQNLAWPERSDRYFVYESTVSKVSEFLLRRSLQSDDSGYPLVDDPGACFYTSQSE